MFRVYTDGACSGNPGPGGWAAILVQDDNEHTAFYDFDINTTNNRMELLAVITGLEALKQPGSNVTVYTDSKYVADAVEKGWIFRWEIKSFRKIKNPDLWIRFLKILQRGYER